MVRVASRGRFRRRGRFGRRRRFKRPSRAFQIRAKNVFLRMLETQRILLRPAQQNLAVGDGVTPVIRLYGPLQTLVLGDLAQSIDGDQIWARGFKIRAFITAGAAIAADFNVIITFFWSSYKADVTADGVNTDDSGVTYGNTTTSIAVPTQDNPGAENLQIFDSDARPFTGENPMTKLNPDYVQVVKRRTYRFRNQGVSTTDAFKVINMWCPINRRLTVLATEGDSDGALPLMFKEGNPYYTIQVHAQGATTAGTIATIDKETTVYWKNL